ncbi:hypothetical protein HHI36_011571 [Cryptolaemus montrouzieri]|uniref:HTH psq-type domain-containing protein n=1 Tax=Cryptolaemus montrouzieri TaxID=559131 RepID=A0ABD2MM48_9CUCU
MPRKMKRTTTKASWTVQTLENAVQKLLCGSTFAYKVSKKTGIPYSTLKKRFRIAKSNNASYKCPPKLGKLHIFIGEPEAIMADHQFGVANRLNEAKSAGRDFLTGFFQRHPDLCIRKPEVTLECLDSIKSKWIDSLKHDKRFAEKREKRKKTTNKEEKVKRIKKKLFEDETDTSEGEDVENLRDDGSEYSEEETLCAVGREKVTKCGNAEVTVMGS